MFRGRREVREADNARFVCGDNLQHTGQRRFAFHLAVNGGQVAARRAFADAEMQAQALGTVVAGANRAHDLPLAIRQPKRV